MRRKETLKPTSSYKLWKNTSAKELRTFHGIILWTGLISNVDMKDNWSDDILYKTNFKYIYYCLDSF